MQNTASAVAAALLLLLSACEKSGGLDLERRRAEAVLKTDLRTMRDCLEQYRGDHGRCPAGLDELVRAGYLHKLPVDPITHSSDTWVAVFGSETGFGSAGDGSPCAEAVVDVKSGSDRLGLDGTAYSSW